jgi:hypothetical protein
MPMNADRPTSDPDQLAHEVNRAHMQHFTDADPRCRALQLPEGVLLRYTLSEALYFYLRTGVHDGKIRTSVFASDSPYDRLKAAIGDVTTPMFEAQADLHHLRKVERLLRGWVEFVQDSPDGGQAFRSFPLEDRRE